MSNNGDGQETIDQKQTSVEEPKQAVIEPEQQRAIYNPFTEKYEWVIE